jgi:cyanophycinase-like exopeptidase
MMTTPFSPGTITFISSGEMSARMSAAHRAIMARITEPLRAVFLDTPAGFQENAAELAHKAAEYFNHNLQKELTIVSFKSKRDAAPEQLDEAARQVSAANYIFAGPGSPTYAVRNWIGTPIHDALRSTLSRSQHIVFASSAAIAASRFVVPVYELYKAGHDPYWVDGLDLLGRYGLELAIAPHWNNSEGGTAFDTRYCFIGKRRLKEMESLLPDTATIVGIDENTACTFDLAAQQCEVIGAGRVVLRRRGHEKTFGAGTRLGWEEFNPR